MIYRLQKKFILISALSILIVITLIFCLMTLLNVSSMNRTLDTLADSVSRGGGKFPDSFAGPIPDQERPGGEPGFDFITPETPFSTRHFTVWFDKNGEIVRMNTESIFAITDELATEYATEAVADRDDRGWISNYRYKVFFTENGKAAVFIDGSTNRAALFQSMMISCFVLLGCALLVLLLIVLLSKRVVKPVAESYEKQKQFVTDINHELKTPLTLILANLDIAETELGQNEWLDDIRSEGRRMTELVNQLVALSRMDEDSQSLEAVCLPISEIVSDIVSEFRISVEARGKSLSADIAPSITCMGDETLIRRLISVLMDNALKYCDAGGEISVVLRRKRNIVFTVENTYLDIESMELDRLFDRFYRADKARTYAGGYGIGLSIAKAIVQKHRGEITAYKKGAAHIGFKVVFKNEI
ncbi:MAG: HAMP domain-containing histidine kinase [Clostridia bacterium]|nr:HAMP domain-containing histidine kinase [Clostridia bacterium]